MATASYCAFENTAKDIHVCLNKLTEMNFDDEKIEDLDSYERRGLTNLVDDARKLVEMYDAMTS